MKGVYFYGKKREGLLILVNFLKYFVYFIDVLIFFSDFQISCWKPCYTIKKIIKLVRFDTSGYRAVKKLIEVGRCF